VKHCPYCHTDYARTETRCTSCQAPDYENRCVACSTIFSTGECPQCGLGVSDELRSCSNCGKRTKDEYCPDCADLAAKVALGEQEYKKNQEILASSKQIVSGKSCLLGFYGLHTWRGCTCVRCGKKKEDGSGHDWFGCTCRICGDVRDSNHSFYPVGIGEDVERCSICGKTKNMNAEPCKAEHKKEQNKLLGTIIALILFPLAGILMIWFYQTIWSQKIKRNVSIIAGVWFILWLLLLILSGIALSNLEDGASRIPEGYAMVPAAAGSFSRRNYEYVVAEFRAAGFTNIVTEGLGDLITGWLNPEGSVSRVSVGGVSDFNARRAFPVNAEVRILYHSFP